MYSLKISLEETQNNLFHIFTPILRELQLSLYWRGFYQYSQDIEGCVEQDKMTYP